jgi:hypothetical protein
VTGVSGIVGLTPLVVVADRPTPESEVEVTPAVIEAGLEHLFTYNAARTDPAEVVSRLFRAMYFARLHVGDCGVDVAAPKVNALLVGQGG